MQGKPRAMRAGLSAKASEGACVPCYDIAKDIYWHSLTDRTAAASQAHTMCKLVGCAEWVCVLRYRQVWPDGVLRDIAVPGTRVNLRKMPNYRIIRTRRRRTDLVLRAQLVRSARPCSRAARMGGPSSEWYHTRCLLSCAPRARTPKHCVVTQQCQPIAEK